MRPSSQRGSAIIMLFIAVALFGLVAYAFLQGSRSNLSMITGEADKAKTTESQQCANAVSLATIRLKSRGCGTLISSAADGSNANPGAPTDGSCSIYHVNGGGLKPCTVAAVAGDPCLTGPIGTVCTSDGAFYMGETLGIRTYAMATDASTGIQQKTSATNTPGTGAEQNGATNTDTLIAAGAAAHPAAQLCRTFGPQWYLPTTAEYLNMMYDSNTVPLASLGFTVTAGTYYWTSNDSASLGMAMKPDTNSMSARTKTSLARVRCFRH